MPPAAQRTMVLLPLQNAALLGYLAHGTCRLLVVTDVPSSDDAESDQPHRGRVAARAMARLLGRADNGAPVIFVDQPLYGHHVSTGDDPAADAAIRELLDVRLIDEARELGRQLRIPVVSWSECVAPACDAAAAEGGVPSARAEEMTRQGRVAIVELDGIAPQTYCNLRGRLVRGSDEARGVAPARREEESPAELYPEALLAGRHAAEDRLIVYAFAPLDALEIEP